MLFNYKSIDNTGAKKEGSIEAVSVDVAIDSLQKRGLVIAEIVPAEKKSWMSNMHIGSGVAIKEVVILSRQMATLFQAQVSALKIFHMLAEEVENDRLRASLVEIADDLQGGSSISKALSKHPVIFSEFYVNLVRAGEETGKLDETFNYLADYLDRNYEVISKARNALIYPAFVISVFLGVMTLMFTLVIPKIGDILLESGQPIPVYTQVILGISDFLTSYGFVLLAGLVISAFFLVRYTRTEEGKLALSRFKLSVPYVGALYKKLYLSVISDNMNTMVLSGIPMTRAIEVTASVVGNDVYKQILSDRLEAVKGGSSFSQSLSQYE